MLSFAGVCNAQYNSDWREVKRKKIKTAMAYNLNDNGDTTFWKYSYDRNGRLVQKELYSWDYTYHSATYDVNGNRTSSVGIRSHQVTATIPELTRDLRVRETVTLDTVEYDLWKYDLRNNELEFTCTMKYLNGNRWATYAQCISPDTIMDYYVLPSGKLKTGEMTVRYKVDSIENGYAWVHYLIHEDDTTCTHIQVIVLDDHNNNIREYYVSSDSLIGKSQNGRMYHPLQDSSLRLVYFYSYVHEYSWTGRLKRSRQVSHAFENEDIVTVYPRHERNRFNSLEDIKRFGTVVYEYYE